MSMDDEEVDGTQTSLASGDLDGRGHGSGVRLRLVPEPQTVESDRESAAETSEPRKPLLGVIRGTSLRPGIRSRILFLVVLSAVLPSLLVGVASYLTARDFLVEKITSQLASRAASAAERVHLSFQDRVADTEVFASSFLVTENLELWALARKTEDAGVAGEARTRIAQYLAQIQERYPLYRSLSIFDIQGRLVSAIDSSGAPAEIDALPRFPADQVVRFLDTSRREPLLYVLRPVISHRGQPLGSLVTGSGMEELRRHLATDVTTESGRLRVLADSGRPLYDSATGSGGELPPPDSEGIRRCLRGQTGVAEYRDETGTNVLGAFHSLEGQQVGILVEMESQTALSANSRLRDLTLLISLLAAGLVSAIGFGLALGLTRPIEALIKGAKAVSRGDLSQEIPVSSMDQIGYLTQVFNHMIRSLRDSRSRLELISRTDDLTGLFNRRHLTAVFETELEKVEETGKPLSILMIDFDRFKDFNDRFGHLEGDLLLQEASRFLMQRTHPRDSLARYGGEEFVALLPDTDKRNAARLAERLRREFADAHSAGESTRAVTISIGVASAPEDGSTEEALISAADAALYRAKREGRNQVQVAIA